MKVLVFAHTPPPHHGQSYMVERLLTAFGGDARSTVKNRNQLFGDVQCFHINARLSDQIAEIGRFEIKKIFRLFKYVVQAIWCRFRYDVRIFYYVPAPAIKSAIYRDWFVMALCRSFFPNIVFHWHAAGLGRWLQCEAKPWQRWISQRLLGKPRLSIVLGEHNRDDALPFRSKEIAIIPNGIPDPIPDFETKIREQRISREVARRQVRQKGEPLATTSDTFNVLFLSLCHREKGLFDALDAVALANQALTQKNLPFKIKLTVAGKFYPESAKTDFARRIAEPDLQSEGASVVEYVGFVDGEAKWSLFSRADCFCFPTYYPAESFGLVLVEAMAFGLPIVTTRWRNIPELLPNGYPGLVDPKNPEQISEVLQRFLMESPGFALRELFLARFVEKASITKIRDALNRLGTE